MSLTLSEKNSKHIVAAAMSLTSSMDWDRFQKNTGLTNRSIARSAWLEMNAQLKRMQSGRRNASAANAKLSSEEMDIIVAIIASAKHGEHDIDIEEFRRNGGITGPKSNAQAIWLRLKKKALHHHSHTSLRLQEQEVKVLVGPREKLFNVPRVPIMARSAVFKDFLATYTTTVVLPDIDSTHFETYISMLWMGEDGKATSSERVMSNKHPDHLIGVSIVAAKMIDPVAQSLINREIVRNIAICKPSSASLDAVYGLPRGGTDTSLLRRILVDNLIEWPADRLRQVLPHGRSGEALKNDIIERFVEKRDQLAFERYGLNSKV